MDEHVRGLVYTLPTAKDVWDTVKALYSDDDNSTRIYELYQEATHLRQEDGGAELLVRI